MARPPVQAQLLPLNGRPPTAQDFALWQAKVNEALTRLYASNPYLGGKLLRNVEFSGVIGTIASVNGPKLYLARAADALALLRLPAGNNSLSASGQGAILCSPGAGQNSPRAIGTQGGIASVDPRFGLVIASINWSSWFPGITAGDKLVSQGGDATLKGAVKVDHGLGTIPAGWLALRSTIGFANLREVPDPRTNLGATLNLGEPSRTSYVWLESEYACLADLYVF